MFETNLGDDRLGDAGDAFYQHLMKVHEGLTEKQSHALNVRLVLLMANCIGDEELLHAILSQARENP